MTSYVLSNMQIKNDRSLQVIVLVFDFLLSKNPYLNNVPHLEFWPLKVNCIWPSLLGVRSTSIRSKSNLLIQLQTIWIVLLS